MKAWPVLGAGLAAGVAALFCYRFRERDQADPAGDLPGVTFVRDPSIRVTEHFMASEFRSKLWPSPGWQIAWPLVDGIEALRSRLGVPVRVVSGFRSRIHNATVGGVSGSLHLRGLAADIVVLGRDVDSIALAARAVGLGGVGTYYRDGFVHVDIGHRREWSDRV